MSRALGLWRSRTCRPGAYFWYHLRIGPFLRASSREGRKLALLLKTLEGGVVRFTGSVHVPDDGSDDTCPATPRRVVGALVLNFSNVQYCIKQHSRSCHAHTHVSRHGNNE